MGTSEGYRYWNVFDGAKDIPSTPEALMSEINTAIANLEYARATTALDPPSSSVAKNNSSDDNVSPQSSSVAKNNSSDDNVSPQYDARKADEAYKAGCLALAEGKLDEALRSLKVSLSNCPPDKTSAIAKLRSLISLTAEQLQKSNK